MTFYSNGGTFSDNTSVNSVAFTRSGPTVVTKHCRTAVSVDSTGKQIGTMNDSAYQGERNLAGDVENGDESDAKIIKMPGATSMHLVVYYGLAPVTSNYVTHYAYGAVWAGEHPAYKNELVYRNHSLERYWK